MISFLASFWHLSCDGSTSLLRLPSFIFVVFFCLHVAPPCEVTFDDKLVDTSVRSVPPPCLIVPYISEHVFVAASLKIANGDCSLHQLIRIRKVPNGVSSDFVEQRRRVDAWAGGAVGPQRHSIACSLIQQGFDEVLDPGGLVLGVSGWASPGGEPLPSAGTPRPRLASCLLVLQGSGASSSSSSQPTKLRASRASGWPHYSTTCYSSTVKGSTH